MPMIQCDKHGLQGVKCVCNHIQESVYRGLDIKITEIHREDLLVPKFWLCDNCKNKWASMVDENTKEEFIEALDLLCGQCFDVWYNSKNGYDS